MAHHESAAESQTLLHPQAAGAYDDQLHTKWPRGFSILQHTGACGWPGKCSFYAFVSFSPKTPTFIYLMKLSSTHFMLKSPHVFIILSHICVWFAQEFTFVIGLILLFVLNNNTCFAWLINHMLQWPFRLFSGNQIWCDQYRVSDRWPDALEDHVCCRTPSQTSQYYYQSEKLSCIKLIILSCSLFIEQTIWWQTRYMFP